MRRSSSEQRSDVAWMLTGALVVLWGTFAPLDAWTVLNAAMTLHRMSRVRENIAEETKWRRRWR